MTDAWTAEMVEKIDQFFSNATNDDIKRVLEESDFEFYKRVKSPYEEEYFSFDINAYDRTSINTGIHPKQWDNIHSCSIAADEDVQYMMAA
jgi:hypothetical protein